MPQTWLLTALFAATGAWFAIGCARHCGADRVSHGGHAVMSVAMIAMTLGWDLPVWLQVVVFTGITVWFAGLATVPHRPHGLRAVHHAFMGVGMVWMACAMSVPAGHPIMLVFAVYFLVASVPLLGWSLDAGGHAIMSAATGILLLAM
nr:DUF5134 domain-containing protein [Kibdelosporangium sp. MJ126-NF4]CEL22410.1 Probable integral membrane protein [Kibdelosporangium sp. MJ126-NF4]CTQ89265.1 Probable integral membrane protein [Kibdelosporangium sp. MJ126-NF4]